MKDRDTRSLLRIVSVLGPIVAAAVYLGVLTQKVSGVQRQNNEIQGTIQKTIKDQFGSAIQTQLEEHLTARFAEPRTVGSGIEKGFNNDAQWGRWSEPVYCPQGYFVCGLKQKIEDDQGRGDDSAMNAVAFYCCPK